MGTADDAGSRAAVLPAAFSGAAIGSRACQPQRFCTSGKDTPAVVLSGQAESSGGTRTPETRFRRFRRFRRVRRVCPCRGVHSANRWRTDLQCFHVADLLLQSRIIDAVFADDNGRLCFPFGYSIQ